MFRMLLIDQDVNASGVATPGGRGQNQLSIFSCNVCAKVFMSLSHMRQHCLIHTNLKPYRCSKCEYATNTKGTPPTQGVRPQHKGYATNTRGTPPTQRVCHQHKGYVTNTKGTSPTQRVRSQHTGYATNTRDTPPTQRVRRQHKGYAANTRGTPPTQGVRHQQKGYAANTKGTPPTQYVLFKFLNRVHFYYIILSGRGHMHEAPIACL